MPKDTPLVAATATFGRSGVGTATREARRDERRYDSGDGYRQDYSDENEAVRYGAHLFQPSCPDFRPRPALQVGAFAANLGDGATYRRHWIRGKHAQETDRCPLSVHFIPTPNAPRYRMYIIQSYLNTIFIVVYMNTPYVAQRLHVQ